MWKLERFIHLFWLQKEMWHTVWNHHKFNKIKSTKKRAQLPIGSSNKVIYIDERIIHATLLFYQTIDSAERKKYETKENHTCRRVE